MKKPLLTIPEMCWLWDLREGHDPYDRRPPTEAKKIRKSLRESGFVTRFNKLTPKGEAAAESGSQTVVWE